MGVEVLHNSFNIMRLFTRESGRIDELNPVLEKAETYLPQKFLHFPLRSSLTYSRLSIDVTTYSGSQAPKAKIPQWKDNLTPFLQRRQHTSIPHGVLRRE